MASLLSRWAPQLRSKANLVFDLASVAAATLSSTALSQLALGPVLVPLVAAQLGIWATASFVMRYYDPWAKRGKLDEAALLSLLVLAAAAGLGLGRLLGAGSGLPREGQFLLLLWPMVLLPRMLFFRRLDLRALPLEGVLIVGVGPMGRCTMEELEQRRRRPQKVIAFLRFQDEPQRQQVGEVAVLGSSEELEAQLRELVVDEVYLAGDLSRHAREMQAAIQACERFGIPFALPAYSFRLSRARPAHTTAAMDGYLHYVMHEVKWTQRNLKRLLDILASASLLALLAPLLMVVAALIKLGSPGPVFFKQKRVGLRGRPFNMFKFRSMVVNAEQLRAKLEVRNQQSGPVFKLQDDPRITLLGRFLRKHSVDELPQLFNVLRGDMSLVGPRPPLPQEVKRYEAWQRRRLSVRPGLTCIWQVSGRNAVSFQEWMYLDMRYIDHWSLSEDLSLILKTVPAVLSGRGAS